jgi:flavin-dependent dehydrogenase
MGPSANSLDISGGEINVCAMIRADIATRLDDVFALNPALCERSHSWTRVTDVVATSPLTFRARRTENNGVLCAGDAAAFIDPFVGDGISLALRSGVLASGILPAFWQGTITLDRALQVYRAEYDRRFARAFQTASRIRKLLDGSRLVRWLALQAMQIPVIFAYVVGNSR